MEFTTLNDGNKMPMLGFGVFQVPRAETTKAVSEALKVGYRLIDTAAAYGNEDAVGDAIINSDVPRAELFITTKVWNQDHGFDETKRAVDNSLKALRVDYLDLYLIHQPLGDYYGSWRAMEELHREGVLRSIGVSNFNAARIQDLMDHNEIAPAVNQIEINPFHQEKQDREFMKRNGIQAEGWAPFAEGGYGIFTNPVLKGIADKHDVSIPQVVLRWEIQSGVVTIPKSVHIERIVENFDIWDFKLTDDDMKAISTLDIEGSGMAHHDDPEFVARLNNLKIHD